MNASDQNNPNQDGASFEQMPVEERKASITLRKEDARQLRADSLRTANQSLTDALRITYYVVQGAIVVLALVFVVSGFARIDEGQRGLLVRFGKIVKEDVPPGPAFNLPSPAGEVLKVNTGLNTLVLEDSFFFRRNDAQKAQTLEDLAGGSSSLIPGNDGSLITADRNLAHLEIAATYEVADAGQYVANLRWEDANQIQQVLTLALERATLQTVAQLNFNTLNKRGSTATTAGVGAIETDIKSGAQDMLDRMNSGILIRDIALQNVTPPMRVRPAFASVVSAGNEAEQARRSALTQRTNTLASAAGPQAEELLRRIDVYGLKLEQNAADAEESLDLVFALFDGSEVGSLPVAGDASRILSDAQRYRTNVVADAQRKGREFQAKLSQYRTAPGVFLQREWTDAMTAFLDSGKVEAVWAPINGETLELHINSDPDIARRLQTDRQEQLLRQNDRLERFFNN